VTLVTTEMIAWTWFNYGMFLADQRLCVVSIGIARARLADLVTGTWLTTASKASYQEGMNHLLWTGTPDDPPGLPRLARTHFLDPIHREDSTTMGMRWEATSVTGSLYPAMDANLTLTAEGAQHTRLTLTGVYRAPIETLSAVPQRALLHKAATTTIRALLTRIGEALETDSPKPR
jgi:hypothetical protein